MAKQQAPVETVKPKYTKLMRFPVEVAIPVQVALVSGVDRRLRINGAADAVPVPVVEWLQNDHRYAGWFSETLPPKKSPAEVAAADAPKRRQTVKATVKGESTPDVAAAEVDADELRTPAESE